MKTSTYKIKNLSVFTEGKGINRKLLILVGIFLGSFVALDTVTFKIVQVGPFIASIGTFFFPVTFLITDVITDVWGKRVSYKLVWMAVLANAVAILIYTLSVVVPPASFWAHQPAFATVFLSVPRIMLASIFTFFVTQTYDIWAFAKIKEWTRGRHLWIRNNASTIGSQLMNNAIFVALAFVGTMSAPNLMNLFLVTSTIKILFALFDTPFCYLLVAWAKKEK